MNSGINLLPKEKGKHKEKKFVNILRLSAIILLLFLLASSFFLYFINQKLSDKDLLDKEKVIVENYKTVNSKMVKLFLTHDRLSAIEKIFSEREKVEKERNDIQNITNDVQKQVPLGITITNIKVDGKHIDLSTSSNSLSLIDNMLSNLAQLAQNNKKFRSVTLGGIAFNGASYDVSLHMDL